MPPVPAGSRAVGVPESPGPSVPFKRHTQDAAAAAAAERERASQQTREQQPHYTEERRAHLWSGQRDNLGRVAHRASHRSGRDLARRVERSVRDPDAPCAYWPGPLNAIINASTASTSATGVITHRSRVDLEIAFISTPRAR